MDAVGCAGEVVNYAISEHIENSVLYRSPRPLHGAAEPLAAGGVGLRARAARGRLLARSHAAALDRVVDRLVGRVGGAGSPFAALVTEGGVNAGASGLQRGKGTPVRRPRCASCAEDEALDVTGLLSLIHI